SSCCCRLRSRWWRVLPTGAAPSSSGPAMCSFQVMHGLREMSSGRSDDGRRSLSEPQSSLQSGGLDRSHDLLLEDEEDRQGRQSSDGRSGQNIIPVSRVLLLERLE